MYVCLYIYIYMLLYICNILPYIYMHTYIHTYTCICMLCLIVFRYTHACSIHRDQKKNVHNILDSFEVFYGCWEKNQVLCKFRKYSKQLSHLSSPKLQYFSFANDTIQGSSDQFSIWNICLFILSLVNWYHSKIIQQCNFLKIILYFLMIKAILI